MREIDEAHFDEETRSGTVLVDFTRKEGCPYCSQLLPILEKVEKEVGPKVKVVKIDVDTAQERAESLKLSAVPTMILFRDGKEIGRLTGLKDPATILNFIHARAAS